MSEELFDKSKRILILVESPEKARTISKIFRDADYKNVVVLATIGHFTKIEDGNGYHNTGIYPEDNFKADYVVDSSKKDVVKELKEQVKVADFVYLCQDPDREGEAIAWSAREFLKIPKSKYRRATYQAINQKAIFDAIRNARDIDNNLVNAAHARSFLDKGLGYRLSTVARDNGKGKSVGRCQSVALKLVVDRDKEIEAFVPEKYFDLFLHFTKNKVGFKAKYQGTDKHAIKRIKNEAEAHSIIDACKDRPYIVKNVEHKDKKEYPKPPFSTIAFQQECATKLGLTTKQSAECAQKLFEAGKISYHRTDSEVFEEDFENTLKSFVKKNYPKEYVSGSVIKGKNDENAQEGHEALHCLDLSLTPELFAKECFNDLLVKVYRIIYNRTIATALKPAITSQTIYNIYNGEHKFTLNSNELVFDGYRCVYSYKDDDDKDEIVKETFKENEELQKCKLELQEKQTQPPHRFNEATFLKELKEKGIGRPSTYSKIVETVKSVDRNYCTVEDKCLKSTELGRSNVEFLDENFSDIINLDYTREMEESLDLIAQGKLNYLDFLSMFFKNLEESVKKVEKVEKVCPECGSPMKLRRGQYGAFWGCTSYPNCKHTEKAK